MTDDELTAMLSRIVEACERTAVAVEAIAKNTEPYRITMTHFNGTAMKNARRQ